MENLRLILLLLGAVVVVGVYLYSRTQSSQRRREFSDEFEHDDFREPRLVAARDDDDLPDDLPPLRAVEQDEIETAGISLPADELHADGRPEPDSIKPPAEEKIIVLNILPREAHERFLGSDLLDVFDRAGLEYGLYNVFHRMKETPVGAESVFSVASATEPGSFDITTMDEQEFRGLSLFMVLPGPMRGVDAFADMLATSRRIAEQIRGEVKDRQRSTLTRQTAHHIREEIIAFEHRLQHTR